jgi:hypothetical protein
MMHEDPAVAANPVEQIVLAVVVRDESDALLRIHQEQTAAGHVASLVAYVVSSFGEVRPERYALVVTVWSP